MATIRTRPSRTYIPPRREEMREMAKKCEVKSFSTDLVEDLCNLASGGEIRPPSEYQEEVRMEADTRVGYQPTPGRDGSGAWWKKSDGTWTQTRQDAVQSHLDRGMRYQQSVCDFLQTVELDKFPGSSPLEQVMNLLKLLSKQQGGQGSGDGDPLPIFTEQDGQKVGDDMNRIMDDVESLTDEEKELLDPADKNADAAGDGGKDSLQKMKIAEDFAGDRGRQEMLRISRKLDTLSRMKVQRESKFIPDPEGDDVRNRPIKNLGEVARVAKTSWATYQQSRTLFWYKATTGQLPVRERGIRSERKQLLYLIIDCSGSMDEGQRLAKACGVLMNRLKAVMQGEAVLYWRLFDTSLREEHFVSSKEEAKAAMEELRKGNFSGGGTSINGCSKAALLRIEEIMREGGTHRPELVVITDGDDKVSLKAEDLGETRIHAFVVEKTNAALTDLAVRSGGVGIGNL